MKRLTTLFLLLFTSIAHAQEDTAPWPPDPTDIFAPGVEVVSVEVVEEPLSTLNPASTTDISICNGERPTFRSSWFFYTDSRVSRATLCNVHTGELVGIFPAGTTTDLVFESPSGEWLVFSIMRGDQPPYYDEYYSVEVATGQQIYLGQLGALQMGASGVSVWIDDHIGIIPYGEGTGGSFWRFYSFDVTKPDSLQELMAGYPSTYDNPPRAEYLETEAILEWRTGVAWTGHHIPCTLTVFDASHGFQHYELGYDCSPVIRASDGYYFVRYDGDSRAVSTLVHLSLESGDITEVYVGEIETLVSTSSDERYAILVLDDNGVIDHVNVGGDADWCCWENLNARLAVFDLLTQRIVYRSPAYYGLGNPVIWTDDNRLILILSSRTSQPWIFYSVIHLVEFSLSEPVVTSVELGENAGLSIQSFSPSKTRVLFSSDNNNVLSIVDFTQQRVISVFVNPYEAGYRINSNSLQWIDDERLFLRIHPLLDRQPDQTRSITYTIRLP